MTNIGSWAFVGCYDLTSITIKATVPPTFIGRANLGISEDLPIYVPKESVSAYKSAEYWKDLNIIGSDEAGISDIIIDNANKTTRKVLRDGKLIIRKAGKTYTLKGAEMK